MLNAVLFVADPQMANLVRTMSAESNEFAVESVVELSQVGYAVARTAGTTQPDVLLLELTDAARDLPQAAVIHRQFPEVPLVGLASNHVSRALGSVSASDLTSLAVWPFDVSRLEHAISVAVHEVHGQIHENLVAFLPGKAGSGASTAVLHTGRALAEHLKLRVLVIESDLHSGHLSSTLQVEPRLSIRRVLAEAPEIDNLAWERCVTSADGLEFLLTDTLVKEPIPSWAQYFQLLRFVAPKYDMVLADLPEIVNEATAEIVRRARAVYVVSTPELASLKLSKQRRRELDRWGVEQDRVFALLNRVHRGDVSPKDAEEILECPVAATFPNDYKALQKEIVSSKSIDQHSALGEAYVAFARILMGEAKESKWFEKLFA